MYTSIPLYTYADCAHVLDGRRLAAQRVEVLQIYNYLTRPEPGPLRGWRAHPAVRMWQGSEWALLIYGVYVCREWTARIGKSDGMMDNFVSKFSNHPEVSTFNEANLPLPPWWGDEAVHSSHRSLLLSKNPGHYKQFEWPEKPSSTLHWPVEELDQ